MARLMAWFDAMNNPKYDVSALSILQNALKNAIMVHPFLRINLYQFVSMRVNLRVSLRRKMGRPTLDREHT